ncbi:helix-turn-helix domain-containing protein [Armatimonas sp.]|uniref:helix-turn-helix domain-containing protein n=1 Tax=Armatimonas sp. TaxID=1872638 RepID=UPI00374D9EF6
MENTQMHAYSYLKRLLKQQEISVPELQRRIRTQGLSVNLKSLYRLSDDTQPVDRLDMRVAGAICSVFSVRLSDWIVFQEESQMLHTLAPQKQSRLDTLMGKNNQGELTATEREELRALVREAEEMMLVNARLLSQQQQRLKPEVLGSSVAS